MNNNNFWDTYLNIISVLGYISLIMFIILIYEKLVGRSIYGSSFNIVFGLILLVIFLVGDKKSLRKTTITFGFFGIFSEIIGIPFIRPGWGFLGIIIFGIFPLLLAYWISK